MLVNIDVPRIHFGLGNVIVMVLLAVRQLLDPVNRLNAHQYPLVHISRPLMHHIQHLLPSPRQISRSYL